MIEEELKRLIREVLIEEGIIKTLPYIPPKNKFKAAKTKWKASDGALCPKCKREMILKYHPPHWQPKPEAAYFFKEWLFCKKCNHVQFQEKDKVYATPAVRMMREETPMGRPAYDKPPWED